MKRQYRIVRDKYAGFTVQYKLRWWPFWAECSASGVGFGLNTHKSLSEAVSFAERHADHTRTAVAQYLEFDA